MFSQHSIQLGIIGVSSLGLLGTVDTARAQSWVPESAGGRIGVAANFGAQTFHQAEGFANWNLPWGWDLGSRFRVQSRLDFSAGWLSDSHTDSAVGTLGPSLVLSREQLPITLEVGVSPTLISESKFATKDFGEAFQFTSHIGLNFELPWHLAINYRFQHMSNAGIGNSNPGLNLHVFGLSYVF